MKKTLRYTFIVILLLTLTGFISPHQKQKFWCGDILAEEEAEFTSETRPRTVLSKTSVPGTITFSFKDADIRNVMRLIAAKARVNIVYGPEITGVVNMELRDVPWEQALNLVLDLNGYSYQKRGNVIKVLRKEDVGKEPLSTEVFVLNYSIATDVAEAVKQMLSERGSIKTDTRSNTVIVTDIPANINKIEKVLARLDGRTPQVLIETKIIEMKNTLEKDLGIKWTSLKEYKVKLGGLSRKYDSTRSGGQDRDDIYYTYDDDQKKEDYDYVLAPTEGVIGDTVQYDLTDITRRTLTDTFTRYLLKSDVRAAILSATDFELVLSALEEHADVELLSNPRVVTANNEAAEIKIVDEYPVPNYEFDTETSQWSITGFDKEEIGVIFNVTPNISSDGYITMKVEPEVSKLIGLVDFTAGGATVQIPFVGRKKASSKLVIKSGDTLAVGGLVDEDKTKVITKVPVLGDIPVLGRLFSHTDVDDVKKDIIFFITATIIDEETKPLVSEAQPFAYDKTKAEYSKVFEKQKSKADKGSSGGNKGYIISNQ